MQEVYDLAFRPLEDWIEVLSFDRKRGRNKAKNEVTHS
jgi:hypothetical protein